jgi:hypothetical protein
VRTLFKPADAPGKAGTLSEKYASIEMRPGKKPGEFEYYGVARGDAKAGAQPIPAEDLNLPLSDSKNKDGSITIYKVDGTSETRLKSDGNAAAPTVIIKFPPNDSAGRSSETRYGDRSETAFQNGRKEINYNDPEKHGGVKKETQFPSDDPQGRRK